MTHRHWEAYLCIRRPKLEENFGQPYRPIHISTQVYGQGVFCLEARMQLECVALLKILIGLLLLAKAESLNHHVEVKQVDADGRASDATLSPRAVSRPSGAAALSMPGIECTIRFGTDLKEDSCSDALESIPLDAIPRIFGKRTEGDAGIHVALPSRFLSCKS